MYLWFVWLVTTLVLLYLVTKSRFSQPLIRTKIFQNGMLVGSLTSFLPLSVSLIPAANTSYHLCTN